MSREVHVRFCERPEVKFLRPTHPYIPIGRGFLYLVAIIDWFWRAVLAWRLSNTMDAAFCVEALEDGPANRGSLQRFTAQLPAVIEERALPASSASSLSAMR
jgi:transposase InsO family protein